MKDPEQLTLGELMAMLESRDTAGLAEILIHFKEKWNELMDESRRIDARIILRGIEAREKDLTGLDLKGLEIEDSDFTGSDFARAELSDSRITRTSMQSANLMRADVSGMKATQSDFSYAHMRAAKGPDSAYLTGSVNLFRAYIEPAEDYRTAPAVTERGFRMKEMYEHDDSYDKNSNDY